MTTTRLQELAEMRMDAYYYSFEPTGSEVVDKILSAVACAGKAFHHTEDWQEKASPYEHHTGETPVEWIQNAAEAAALAISTAATEELRAEMEDLRKAFKARVELHNLDKAATEPLERRIEELEVALQGIAKEVEDYTGNMAERVARIADKALKGENP